MQPDYHTLHSQIMINLEFDAVGRLRIPARFLLGMKWVSEKVVTTVGSARHAGHPSDRRTGADAMWRSRRVLGGVGAGQLARLLSVDRSQKPTSRLRCGRKR